MAQLRDRILQLSAETRDAGEVAAALTDLLRGLDAISEEIRVLTAEIGDQDAQIQRLLRDQEQMRSQQRRIQQLLPAAALTTDLEGVITAANPAAVALFGAELVQLVRSRLFELLVSDDRPGLRAAAAELTSGARLRRMTVVIGRDGRSTPVEVSAACWSPHAREISWVFVARPAAEAGMDDQVAVSEALVGLAALPASRLEDLELLQRAAATCQEAFGEGAAVSISFGAPTAPDWVASTAAVAQVIDGAQLAQDEGPSVLAFSQRETVASSDLRADPRWPALAADPRVPPGAAVAVPLVVGEELLGVLSLYGHVHPPADRFVRSVEMLASAVAAVLHEALVRDELRRESSGLETALQSRAAIDQAKGIVMAERGCNAQEAFDHLAELSSTQHVKLRDVARILVEQRSAGGSRPA